MKRYSVGWRVKGGGVGDDLSCGYAGKCCEEVLLDAGFGRRESDHRQGKVVVYLAIMGR